MDQPSLSLLRRLAKAFTSSLRAGDVRALCRARQAFLTLRTASDAEVKDYITLQRSQFVLAVESGAENWNALLAAPEFPPRLQDILHADALKVLGLSRKYGLVLTPRSSPSDYPANYELTQRVVVTDPRFLTDETAEPVILIDPQGDSAMRDVISDHMRANSTGRSLPISAAMIDYDGPPPLPLLLKNDGTPLQMNFFSRPEAAEVTGSRNTAPNTNAEIMTIYPGAVSESGTWTPQEIIERDLWKSRDQASLPVSIMQKIFAILDRGDGVVILTPRAHAWAYFMAHTCGRMLVIDLAADLTDAHVQVATYVQKLESYIYWDVPSHFIPTAAFQELQRQLREQRLISE